MFSVTISFETHNGVTIMTYKYSDPSDTALERMREQAAKARQAKREALSRYNWDYGSLYDNNMYQ